nr:MAG TPA: hypothetical protein [Caudoviricetes sp.]
MFFRVGSPMFDEDREVSAARYFLYIFKNHSPPHLSINSTGGVL